MTSAPRFSVIVPVYRHWDLVPPLLEALAGQTLPADTFEVLLINNDPSKPAQVATLPGTVRILPCTDPGSYAARNEGARAARGEWLVFTDADCRPEPDWLAAYAGAQAQDGLRAGPVHVIPPAARANIWEIYEMVRGIPQARYVQRGYAATANLAMSKAVFTRLGGFDAARFSGGDAEFCRRAQAAGYDLQLVEAARVAHLCRADWPALAAKARRIKGGQIRAGSLPRRIAWSLRTLMPPVRDMGNYLSAPEHPPAHRRAAARVRLRLWGVELAEMVRLMAGGAPVR